MLTSAFDMRSEWCAPQSCHLWHLLQNSFPEINIEEFVYSRCTNAKEIIQKIKKKQSKIQMFNSSALTFCWQKMASSLLKLSAYASVWELPPRKR